MGFYTLAHWLIWWTILVHVYLFMVALGSNMDSDGMLSSAFILVDGPFIIALYILHAFSSWITLLDDVFTFV